VTGTTAAVECADSLGLSIGSIRFHHISKENKLLIYTIIFHNWHNSRIVRLRLSCLIGIGTAATGGRALAARIEGDWYHSAWLI
jgi:hypothetical protein